MRCILNCHLTRLASDTRSEGDSSRMFFLVGRRVGDLGRSGYNLGHNALISGKPSTSPPPPLPRECGAIAGHFSDFRLSLHRGPRLTTALLEAKL